MTGACVLGHGEGIEYDRGYKRVSGKTIRVPLYDGWFARAKC